MRRESGGIWNNLGETCKARIRAIWLALIETICSMVGLLTLGLYRPRWDYEVDLKITQSKLRRYLRHDW
jgi:hypothetical protein